MSTASSAAVATPSAVDRILLFICCGLLLVNIGTTVDANETEGNQNRQGINQNRETVIESECHKINGEIFHDKCYFFSELHEAKNYTAAKESCIARKGELAMFDIDPDAGLQIVVSRDTDDPRFWVGGIYVSDVVGWQWENGIRIDSSNPGPFPWGNDEPNHPGVEKCLDILQEGDHHGYNDELCNREHPYICEIGCSFEGMIFPPGSFIHEACAVLQCNGETGLFDNLGYDDHCSTCLVYWDPHILTYDVSNCSCSHSYGYQKCGNHSLTQVGNSTKPYTAVYATFVPCQRSTYYTCVDAVTFKNDNNTIVTVVFQDDMLKITVNGEDVNSNALSTSPTIVEANSIEYPILAWASTYYKVGKYTSCVSLQGSSGILVRYCGDPYNYANTVGVWASPEISWRLRGLCGTANGNINDDFTTRDRSKTWNYSSYNVPEAFTLSWLTDSNNADGSCSGSRKQIEPSCVTNTSLPDIFQNQCENAVMNGFLSADTNLSKVLIDDCVYDMCRVSDAEKWMGSVHGSMPIHSEIKEKTAGHCKHKRTHKCKTHNGHCILKTETCNGTIIENGCHGKKCECCAPSGCEESPKCEKKQGHCMLLKDAMKCDGIVNSELCIGNKCACCYPKAKKCEESDKCSKVNGECIGKWNWKNCDGKLKKKWCKGKKCGCCYQ